MFVPEAIEPIRHKGKIHWRVDDHCVDIDEASWHQRRLEAKAIDWTATDSGVPASSARSAALEFVRDALRVRGEDSSNDLAASDGITLLRRLGAVTGDDTLTIAGWLLFVGRGELALDYLYREFEGDDSRSRVNTAGRSLAEEIRDVFLRIEANTKRLHVSFGPAIGQLHNVPWNAAREAVINGLAHRDWTSPLPTLVEHLGDTLPSRAQANFSVP